MLLEPPIPISTAGKPSANQNRLWIGQSMSKGDDAKSWNRAEASDAKEDVV
jgi:hypothetical protein